MSIQEKLVNILKDNDLKIASAESCTGGMISKMITDVPGAGDVFELGVCSYSNRIKNQILGVEQSVLDEFTELSTQCAEAMARGVLEKACADIAVSTTGVAGPTGGTDENPIGTIYVAIVTSDRFGGKVVSKRMDFNSDGCNDRDRIRRRCAEYMLEAACAFVEENL